jgi:hypothetical protein
MSVAYCNLRVRGAGMPYKADGLSRRCKDPEGTRSLLPTQGSEGRGGTRPCRKRSRFQGRISSQGVAFRVPVGADLFKILSCAEGRAAVPPSERLGYHRLMPVVVSLTWNSSGEELRPPGIACYSAVCETTGGGSVAPAAFKISIISLRSLSLASESGVPP